MTGEYAEEAFFDPGKQRVTAMLGTGSSIKDDEVEVDSRTYQQAVEVHYTDPFHLAIRRYLIESVLRVPAEIKSDDDDQSPERDAFILKKWIYEQVPKVMGEGWTLGLVPIEMQIDPETNWPIPYVYRQGLGSRYKITMRERRVRREVQYRFYHIHREAGKRGQIQRSSKVIVYNGFDAEPVHDTGKLTSVVASLLQKQRDYEDNYGVARVALMNMARPMVLLETTRISQGMDSQRPEMQMPFYGGQDWLPEDRRQRVAAAATQLDVLGRQQQAFWNQYMDQIDAMARAGTKSVHQAHLNMVPLPADHKSASYTSASMRSDLRELTEIYEDLVTSAYGIQRAHIHAPPGRLQVSETLTNAALVNVINRWRDDLSHIFTDLYRQAFDSMGEIIFPNEVNDTPEGLYTKWDRGLLTWEGLQILTRDMTGIDRKYMEKKEPPRSNDLVANEPSGDRKEKRKRSDGGSTDK